VAATAVARQQQQGWRGPTGLVTLKALMPREQQLAVLAALPGVGPVLAARLLDHFGSLLVRWTPMPRR
jgi:ERCC4-type nuclease